MRYIFCLTLFLSRLFAGSPIPTNQAVADTLIQPVIRDLADLGSWRELPVVVENRSPSDPLRDYITYRVGEALRKMGARIHAPADTADSLITVDLYIANAGLAYTERFVVKFYTATRIRRRADLEINIRIRNNIKQKNMFNQSYKRSFEDTFPASLLNAVESGFVLPAPELPHVRGIRAWLEPALLISSVGAVIYLFFIIRN